MTPTEKLIAEARELDRRATQGPWYAEKKGFTVHGFDLEYRICVVDGGKPVYANPIGGSRPAADREFIIRSRTLLPALCDALEQAQATLEQTWEWDMYKCAQREIGRLREVIGRYCRNDCFRDACTGNEDVGIPDCSMAKYAPPKGED